MFYVPYKTYYMNYLAHLYLSGDDEKIIVGNFIGDYVKGKNFNGFPSEIRKGILMHRKIDTFTDRHPRFREAKKLLQSEFRLYSAVVVDLFYDHLLAQNWYQYSPLTLRGFSKKIHDILLAHFDYLPSRVQGFLPSLIQNRRLESYATREGIQKSLEIMSRYTSLPANSVEAITILDQQFSFFQHNFALFMNDLIDYVEAEFETDIKKPGC